MLRALGVVVGLGVGMVGCGVDPGCKGDCPTAASDLSDITATCMQLGDGKAYCFNQDVLGSPLPTAVVCDSKGGSTLQACGSKGTCTVNNSGPAHTASCN